MFDLSEFDALREVEELRRANRRLEQSVQRAKARSADLVQAVFEAARDAALVVGVPPEVRAPARDRRSRAEAALLLLSDWHFGKRTPSFDSEVAAGRVSELGRKVERIVGIERADHPVRECHALLNGDFVENVGIFPGQAWEVDSSLFAQLFAAASSLAGLLRTLLATFDRVHVWEQAGNHGRLGRRGDHPGADNVDLVVYRLAREQVRSDRLTWHEARSWYSIVECGEYRALLVHGHQVKSFGGNTPAFGITRKVNAWATGVLPAFTDVYMGHFHQPLVLPIANGRGRTFLNPALESDSDYAKEFVAATGCPGQRLHFVDPRRGRVTSERVLWLD